MQLQAPMQYSLSANYFTTLFIFSLITETRLATANRLHVSVRVTTIIGQGNVNPVKIFLSSSLITKQTFVAVCHTV